MKSSIRSVLGFALTAMTLVPAPQAFAAPKVEREAYEALARSADGRVYVLINLQPLDSYPGDRRRAVRASQDEVLSALGSGLEVAYRYVNFPGMTGRVTAGGLAALEAMERVHSVSVDRVGRALGGPGDTSPNGFMEAARVHSALGVTGEGVTVAVIDTGVRADSPHLAGDLHPDSYHFLGGGTDVGPGAPDTDGHGTTVASIITSPEGIAPDAEILAIKIFDARFFLSDLVAAIDHVTSRKDDLPGLVAINMSLGIGPYSNCPCDTADASAILLQRAVLSAREAGIASFAAAGNDATCATLYAPGCLSSAISMGAVGREEDGRLTPFGNVNSCLALFAAGSSVVSGGLFTSWSTAHGTGLAALMAQVSPSLPVDDLLSAMRETATPLHDGCARDVPVINAFHAVCSVASEIGNCDCNRNEVADSQDISGGASTDLNANGKPDECELDCNTNQAPDDHDISTGASRDLNTNAIPDECEPDCNGNESPDDRDIALGSSPDCDRNAVPDECDLSSGQSRDCNANGVPDLCDIAGGLSGDCDRSGVPDECDIAAGRDCDGTGVLDHCEVGPFPRALAAASPDGEPAPLLGAPDGVFLGLGGDAVTYDLGPARVLDGPGSDINVYEEESDNEFRFMDVLVSADGVEFSSLKSTEKLLSERIPGDEALQRSVFARSFDLSASGLPSARYIRIQGKGQGPAGERNGFDLDAIGLIHFDACLPKARQLPGDANQDADVDLSDAVWLLDHLFLGTSSVLPCEGGTASAPGAGDLAIADVNGDGEIDLSDPVRLLGHLFTGSPPHVLGSACVEVTGCPDRCGG